MSQPIIPTATIVFSIISFVLAVVLPIAAVIFFRIKYKMPLYPILFGIGVFILFVMILENAAHEFFFAQFPIATTPWLFVVYAALMAGIFEETGRLISFTVIEQISKKPRTALTGVSYGIGHGGIEAVTIVGMAMLSNIIVSITNNNGSLYVGYDTLSPESQMMVSDAVTALFVTPSWQFLIGGLERVIALTAQIGFSIIMYYAVFSKGKIWLYPVAILCHAVTDVPAALYQAGVITNLVVVESITAFIAAAVIVLAVFVNDKLAGSLNPPVAVLSGGEPEITVTEGAPDDVLLSDADDDADADDGENEAESESDTD